MKIVALTSRFPYPIERGDKLRAFHQLRQLVRHHEVVLVALTEGPVPAHDLETVCSTGVDVRVVDRSRLTTMASVARAGLTGEPLQVGYFHSAGVAAEVRSVIEDEQPDRLYCQLLRTAWAADGIGVPRTIDYQDAFAAAMRRRAAQQVPGIRRLFELEANRIGQYEARSFELFDHHLVISDQDRALLEVPDPEAVTVLPNGVDTDFFCPSVAAAGRDTDRVDVAFVGNMGYPPNVRAAAVLANEIMPRVRDQRPGSRLLLAGARPSRAVRRLAGPHVEVSGWLEDIRVAYRRAKVMVAPLQIGAGLQNKVLESMAMGVPVVTTELVNNAIGATDGVEIALASGPQEFARCTLELLGDDDRRARMIDRAFELVQSRYSWERVGHRLAQLLESADEGG